MRLKLRIAFSVSLIFVSLMASAIFYEVKLDAKDDIITQYQTENIALKDQIYTMELISINELVIKSASNYANIISSPDQDQWNYGIDKEISSMKNLISEVKSLKPTENYKDMHTAYLNSLGELDYAYLSLKTSIERKDSEQLQLAIQSIDESIESLSYIVGALWETPDISRVCK